MANKSDLTYQGKANLLCKIIPTDKRPKSVARGNF